MLRENCYQLPLLIKTANKRDGVETLYIRNILPSADGGCFVVWEREWEKTKENNVSNGRSATTYVHTYYNNDNLLIQYFNKANKMLWQKPVYKEQKKAGVRHAGVCHDRAKNL